MHTNHPPTPHLPMEQTVSPNEHGMRLDAFLAHSMPGLGVRARRRLWEWCQVCVNSKPRKPGFALQTGDIVRITPQEQSAERPLAPAVQHGAPPPAPCMAEAPHNDSCIQPLPQHLPNCPERENLALPCLLEAKDGWFALYKPHGLHTAHVAGGKALSLEGMLPALWPSMHAEAHPLPLPHLVTRLDGPTAGIVLAVSDSAREQAFRTAEAQGKVQKTYAALVHGVPPAPWQATAALDTANRKITKLLATPNQDATRHTHCTPMGALAAAELLRSIIAAQAAQAAQSENSCAPAFARLLSLLRCPSTYSLWQEAASAALPFSTLPCISLTHITIARGARHQIRAHMAGGGYPLLGDTLYSTAHHAQVEAALLHAWQQALHLFATAMARPTVHQHETQHGSKQTEGPIAAQEAARHATAIHNLPLFLQYTAVQSPWLHTQRWPAWGMP